MPREYPPPLVVWRPVSPSKAVDGVLAVLVVCGLAVLMAPAFRRAGNVFDEGLLLAYPLQVLHGAVPHRDFASFYGPGTPWLLAGWYEVAGATQTAERILGLFYQAIIVLSLFFLCLPAGRLAALASAVAPSALLVWIDLEATPPVGALAFGLASLAVLAVAYPGEGRRARGFLIAGLLIAVGVLIRLDFALALLAAAVPFLAGARAAARRRFAVGVLCGAVVYLVHGAIVGPGRISRIVSDLVASGPARRLPIDLGTDQAKVGLFALVAALALLAVAAYSRRRAGSTRRSARTLTALALLSLGLAPYALSRLDWVHVIPGSIPSLAALPAAAAVLAGSLARRRSAAAVGTAVATGVLLVQLAPLAIETRVRQNLDGLRGRPYPRGEKLVVDGRSFRVASADDPRGVRRVLGIARRAERAGARTLFVGPRDLRTSNANDAYLYYLLDGLKPASYYLEMNPRTANRDGSGLADDLRTADVLILNRRWDVSAEPNDSNRPGPSEPNAVVRRDFDVVLRTGPYAVLLRRRAGWRSALSTN